MQKRRFGFTFIELLVATLIFSLVSFSVYLSFSVGIRAWRKGEEGYKIRQEARYLLGRISREMRSALNSKSIMFYGESNNISFCKTANGLFKVSYEFDKKEQAVYRVLKTYRENALGQPGTRSRLASGISGFKLQYSYKNAEKIDWQDIWKEESGAPPFGVKISLTYNQSGASQPAVISKTVLIPSGILKEK